MNTIADRIADRLPDKLLENKRFSRMLREVVLRTIVEQDRERRAGMVRSFFDCCEARGISFSLDERNHLACSDPRRMNEDLLAVMAMSRMEIKDYLLEMRRRDEAEKAMNEKRYTNGSHK
jgi:hypothetical protein